MSEEITEEEKKHASGNPGRRISDAEFAEIRELYELGKASLVELSDQFAISRQTLSAKLKAAGAIKGSRAHEVAKTVNSSVTSSPSPNAAAAVERFSDKRADWIEETRVSGVRQLKLARQLAQKVVQETVASGRPIASADDDLKAVQRFSKLICDNLGQALNVLGADEHTDPDDLPGLRIEDLTDEDILEHHKGTGALPEDATVEDMLSEGTGEIEGIDV